MNRTTVRTHAKRLALGLAALALAAAPSFAQSTYDLCATTGSVTMPGGAIVPIWGYADITGGGDCTTAVATLPGPELRATAGETLTINLTNNLAEPVSFFVPGLPATATGGSAGRFTNEIAMGGGTVSYTFDLTGRSGTFLYQSATDRIRTQVPMGLYGALVVDYAAGQAYADVAYDADQVLIFSEIDPALNIHPQPGNFCSETLVACDPLGTPPVCPGTAADVCIFNDGAKVINWLPQYFLINGQAYPNTGSIPITTGDNVLLRFVNAGLDSMMPTLGGGLYMNLKAEDANRYPHPIQQYGLELEAGKTMDAVIQDTNPGSYAIYDRSGRVTNGAASGGGMLVNLDAAAGAGLLQFASATYSVGEAGGSVLVTVDRIGGSAGAVSVDYATVDGSATAAGPDYTAAVGALNWIAGDAASKTFDITILDDGTYEGDEDFSIALSNATGGAVIGSLASTVVTIVEDDAGPGMLQLSAATYSVGEGGGSLLVTVDRVGGSVGAVSVDYSTSDGTATAGSDYTAANGTLDFADALLSASFSVVITSDSVYEADEDFASHLSNAVGATLGAPSSAVATIVDDDPAPNAAPIAIDDTTDASRGPNVILSAYDIIANDYDQDGSIVASSVVITTGATTQRGGTVTNNNDGTIDYEAPNPSWTGTDTFQYQVNDNDGAISNVATVRINVVK